jgi:hypothetical protein
VLDRAQDDALVLPEHLVQERAGLLFALLGAGAAGHLDQVVEHLVARLLAAGVHQAQERLGDPPACGPAARRG